MSLVFSSTLADVALFVTVVFLAIHLYVRHAFTYWKRRGVRYLEPTSYYGNFKGVAQRREHMCELLQRAYDGHTGEPCVGLYVVLSPALVVRDLQLLRCVFVKDAHVFLDRNNPHPKNDDIFNRSLFSLTGSEWRGLRIKLTPTFTSGRIKRMFHLINECGKQLPPCIQQELLKGGSVGVKDVAARYSTDVIASCAFGVNANALADPDCEFRTYMKRVFQPRRWNRLAGKLLLLLPALRSLLRLQILDPSVLDFVRRTFWDVVDYRKRNNLVRDDFVDLLLQIRQEGQVRAEDVDDLEEIEQDSRYMKKAGKTENSNADLDDNDILGQAFIFIFAGYETSSSVVTQALYELAMHPDIQDRLRQEIQSVVSQHHSEVTYDAIAEMTYLDMVVSETMRKYPTLPVLERICLADYKIEGTNITIKKGTKIFIPVRSIHYDPDIYPDPEKFDPERFNSENKRKIPNFAYLPFGEGPRICIGMRFGQMQVKTALVHILSSFQVRQCPDTPKPPLRLRPGYGILIPKENIVLAFTKLEQALG